MKHLIYLSFVLSLVIAFSSTSISGQTKTVIGYKCFLIQGSSGSGQGCITTKSGKVCFQVVFPRTKWVGFGSSPYHPSWYTGAEYRITLKNGVAMRIVFTGRVNKSIKECEFD